MSPAAASRIAHTRKDRRPNGRARNSLPDSSLRLCLRPRLLARLTLAVKLDELGEGVELAVGILAPLGSGASRAVAGLAAVGGPREGERRRRVEVLQRSLLDVARDARHEVVLLAAEGQPLRAQVLLEHRRAQLRQPPRCLHLRPLCGTRWHRCLEPLRRPLAAATAAAHGLRHAERGDEAADGLHAARLAEPGGVWDGPVLDLL
mmetsp:Transcript_37889/g.125582  ORF Transcript_37889/g.125582 Transcript_37889/m.125582 type:complete len:205 (-) Transcript_37889:667-1281(-)